jgi:hypothetical protein
MRSRFLLSGLRRATSRIVHVEIQSPLYFDPDSYRCPMSLSSELRLVKTLLKIAKECLSPKLKTSCYGTSRTKAQAAGGTEDPCG